MFRSASFAVLLGIAIVGSATEALAAGSCRPTRDGKDRVEIEGGCQSGYVLRGACCESIRAVSQPSGEKTCPAGTMVRLGVCVPRQ